MKVIISGGGTGGHIYPALAIINKLKEKEKNLEVIYIGTHNRMEKDIVPKENIKYIALEIYGLSKTNMIRNIKNIFCIKKAYKKCINIMKEFKPDIVIGVGGYVTYPVIKAAKKLRIKTFIHEQNSIPGKSNRALSQNVDLIGVSFKNSEQYFKGAKKVIYTGNPCSSNALEINKIDKTELGFSNDKKLIILVGGSLGSKTLNDKFKTYLTLVKDESYEILFVTGKALYEEFVKDTKFPENVVIKPYFDPLVGIMKSADLIVSRAGASTSSEILALKIPSILIPSPYVANNHQYYNALDLVNDGVAELIEEKQLTSEKLFIAIKDLLETNKYNKMKKNFDKLGEQSSGDVIYNAIKEVLKDE